VYDAVNGHWFNLDDVEDDFAPAVPPSMVTRRQYDTNLAMSSHTLLLVKLRAKRRRFLSEKKARQITKDRARLERVWGLTIINMEYKALPFITLHSKFAAP
jgi:hypothetical protein